MAAGAYVQRGKAADGREPVRETSQHAPKVDEKKVSSDGQSGFKAKLATYRTSMEKHAWFRVLETTGKGFQKDKVTENAAAMTYYGVFSLFPLFLLFMSIGGIVMQNNEAAREQIMDVIVGLLPQGQEKLREVIQGVIDAKGTAAGLGILALLWGALGWFKIIDSNINEIWGVSKPRSFIKGNLFALTMVGAVGGVALGSFGATAAVNILRDFTGDLLPGTALLWQLAVSALSLLTIAAVFFVLYKFAPQREISFADVWPAALATAVIWELTRRLLAFYIEKNNMVSAYGPIGAAMALLFWIYIASIIILLGAELSYAIAKERRHIPVEEEMEVVAPAGEQPTAKFAPQVGGGHYEAQDEAEPIKAEPGSGAPQVASVDGRGPGPKLGRATTVPAYTSQPQPVMYSREEGKLQDAKPIRVDIPLVALISVCVGFVLGWFRKKEQARA